MKTNHSSGLSVCENETFCTTKNWDSKIRRCRHSVVHEKIPECSLSCMQTAYETMGFCIDVELEENEKDT